MPNGVIGVFGKESGEWKFYELLYNPPKKLIEQRRKSVESMQLINLGPAPDRYKKVGGEDD